MRSCLLLKKRHALREALSQECMLSSFSLQNGNQCLWFALPPPLSLHHHLEKFSRCCFMTFISFRFCLMKLLVQVTGGSNGGTADLSFRGQHVTVPQAQVFLGWSKGFVSECNCRRYQEDPLGKRTSARQRRRQKTMAVLHSISFEVLLRLLARDICHEKM